MKSCKNYRYTVFSVVFQIQYNAKRAINIIQYMACLRDRVLTKIMVGDEVLTYHYGLLFLGDYDLAFPSYQY